MVSNADKKFSQRSTFHVLSGKLFSSECLRWLMIALLPLLILLAYPVDRADYDLWWQMALGKYYIANKTLIVNHAIFSWTPADSTWIYNTCLGSIIIYLFYNMMGGFGLWLFQWLIFGGIFLSFYLFLHLMSRRLDINSIAVIAAVGIACSISCNFYKPELFSALLFCWTLLIFFYIKIKNAKYFFYLYPLIFAFWVNLHGAFVVGLVFLALSFIGETLNRIFFPRKSLSAEDLIHYGIACILSGAAVLLNPYGADYLQSLFPTVMNAIGVKSYTGPDDKQILAYIRLWPYLKTLSIALFYVTVTAWLMTLMILLIGLLSIYEWVKEKSFDFTLLIVSIALYVKGMETGRTSYFLLLAFFFILFYLLFQRLKITSFNGSATIFSLVALSFFFMSVSYITVRYQADNSWFGQELDSFVPVKEAEFLKKHKLEGPIFNDYLIGGYLLWKLYPDYRVFIDPRYGPFQKEVYKDYLAFTMKSVTHEDIKRFRQKYPFRIAILHYNNMNLIFDFLKDSNEWRLLYFEKNAAILIHKSLFSCVQWNEININLSPLRFRKVKNPDILVNVFNIYVRLNPQAGRYIYDISKKNISDCYKGKAELLRTMDMQVRIIETALKQKVDCTPRIGQNMLE
ncbi:MAG: hypothetical protein QUS13_14220 [Smithella sp.]|nr:hypothetical protein [Smithella sp.]